MYVGHRAEQLGEATTVVVSPLSGTTTQSWWRLRRRGLRVMHRSAALGFADAWPPWRRSRGNSRQDNNHSDDRPCSGGLRLRSILCDWWRLTGTNTGGHLGNGDVMIVEADESDGSFLQYPCEVAVVTNIDPDHLSNWGSAENYADGFLRFATAASVRLLVTSADDPGAIALTEQVRRRIAAGLPGPRS